MSSIMFYTVLMAAYIPLTFGQSTTTGLIPISEVVASVVASRSTTVTSSAAAATSSAVVVTSSASATSSAAAASSSVTTPTLKFDAVGTLVACQSTQLFWNITGVEPSLYDIFLRAIDADAADAARSSSSAAAALTSRASSSIATSAVVTSFITPSSSAATLLSASLSTALVGRQLQTRQSAAGNLTIAVAHNAQEPITFVVTLPPGRYYFAGRFTTSPGTAANSNLFRVVEGDDMSCLSSAVATTSTTSTSSAGTQTAGTANNAVETSSISGGAIAGIVIGVLAGLAVLGALLFFCMKKKRRQNRRLNENRFSNLPSASSQDGAEYGQHHHGQVPMAGAWRRDSDPDEKESRPYPARADSDDPTPSLGDRRKQAGPPTSHTLTEKKSTQGFIGKGSNESSAVHSRSSSIGGGEGAKPVGRSTSVKRKPVPSLGPELRGQLERERKMSAGGQMGGGEANRKSYSLVPDLPTPHR